MVDTTLDQPVDYFTHIVEASKDYPDATLSELIRRVPRGFGLPQRSDIFNGEMARQRDRRNKRLRELVQGLDFDEYALALMPTRDLPAWPKPTNYAFYISVHGSKQVPAHYFLDFALALTAYWNERAKAASPGASVVIVDVIDGSEHVRVFLNGVVQNIATDWMKYLLTAAGGILLGMVTSESAKQVRQTCLYLADAHDGAVTVTCHSDSGNAVKLDKEQLANLGVMVASDKKPPRNAAEDEVTLGSIEGRYLHTDGGQYAEDVYSGKHLALRDERLDPVPLIPGVRYRFVGAFRRDRAHRELFVLSDASIQ
jgi:hypothetical protein